MLFSPMTIRELKLKNRIVMPPMCMYVAGHDGRATNWHVVHYASRAIGQVGLIIVEATGVEDRGRITDNDLGIWEDGQIEGLKRIVDAVHACGGKIAIQLGHAGRKSVVEYTTPVAPSAIAFSKDDRTPKALTKVEIQQVIEKFAKAAKRAAAAGFDAVEIHAAHGYLINEFMSPLANRRDDEYGGSIENRVRLLGEVLDAVKSVVPSKMTIFVRVSAHDYEPDGNTPEIMADMLNLVKDKGIDCVNVSSGAVTPFVPRAYSGYQIPFALTIKDKTGLPVIGGGLITEPVQAEQVIKAGVDLVFIGRELLRNPYFPLKAAHTLGQDVHWPQPYERSKYR